MKNYANAKPHGSVEFSEFNNQITERKTAMKALLVFFVMTIITPCFAQTPTEQEIRDAHAFCILTDHFIPPLRSTRDKWTYKPEFAEKCKVVDAAFERLDLAAKAKNKETMDKLDALVKKIGQ